MTIIKKRNNKCGWECGCKLLQPLWKSVWSFLKTNKQTNKKLKQKGLRHGSSAKSTCLSSNPSTTKNKNNSKIYFLKSFKHVSFSCDSKTFHHPSYRPYKYNSYNKHTFNPFYSLGAPVLLSLIANHTHQIEIICLFHKKIFFFFFLRQGFTVYPRLASNSAILLPQPPE
jgi:hypothetical protein